MQCTRHHQQQPTAAGMATDAFEEFVVGHGELWCAQLTAAKIRQLGADCAFMDTRDVLVSPNNVLWGVSLALVY